jgi:hypothetical protein
MARTLSLWGGRTTPCNNAPYDFMYSNFSPARAESGGHKYAGARRCVNSPCLPSQNPTRGGRDVGKTTRRTHPSAMRHAATTHHDANVVSWRLSLCSWRLFAGCFWPPSCPSCPIAAGRLFTFKRCSSCNSPLAGCPTAPELEYHRVP